MTTSPSSGPPSVDLVAERSHLRGLLRDLSYREGDFTLSSGRHSTYLVDVKRTALHPVGARLIGRTLLALLRRHWPTARGVGGRTLGADPVALALALASLDDGGPHLEAFVVRKAPKEHGTSRLIEASGVLHPGAPVVVLEDTSTTGASVLKAVEASRREGFDVVGVMTVVDRGEGAKERLAEAGLTLVALFSADELRAAPDSAGSVLDDDAGSSRDED